MTVSAGASEPGRYGYGTNVVERTRRIDRYRPGPSGSWVVEGNT